MSVRLPSRSSHCTRISAAAPTTSETALRGAAWRRPPLKTEDKTTAESRKEIRHDAQRTDPREAPKSSLRWHGRRLERAAAETRRPRLALLRRAIRSTRRRRVASSPDQVPQPLPRLGE